MRDAISCDSCQLARINGVVCHETGCPDSWIDPETGEGYEKPCWQCGFGFVPESANQARNKYRECYECNGSGHSEDNFDDFDPADLIPSELSAIAESRIDPWE